MRQLLTHLLALFARSLNGSGLLVDADDGAHHLTAPSAMHQALLLLQQREHFTILLKLVAKTVDKPVQDGGHPAAWRPDKPNAANWPMGRLNARGCSSNGHARNPGEVERLRQKESDGFKAGSARSITFRIEASACA